MNFIIFFIYIPLVYSELHRFMTTNTGQTTAETLEFVAVTTLDGKQIDYYDNRKKLIPKTDWMKEFASKDEWKEYIKIREKLQQINNINIHVLVEQSHGLHTYQRKYGCDWDDETGDSRGFDEYAYDGEDFISLDLKERRYITAVQQAKPTVMKWNKDRAQLRFLKQYFRYECVYWLKELWHSSKAAFEKADPPKVSLLQKNPEYYVECHVTGFLFRNTIISWRKNGVEINSSSELETGDTLPNEDGTFQRTLTLYVLSKRWKKSQYACVVEHQSLTETIQRILTVNAIESNNPRSDASDLMSLVLLVIIPVVAVLIVLCVLKKHRKKLKSCYTQTHQSSHQEHGEAPPPLISTPSCDDSSSSEA